MSDQPPGTKLNPEWEHALLEENTYWDDGTFTLSGNRYNSFEDYRNGKPIPKWIRNKSNRRPRRRR